MTMQHAVRHPGSGHAFNRCSDTVIAWKFGPMAGMIKYAGGSAWQPAARMRAAACTIQTGSTDDRRR